MPKITWGNVIDIYKMKLHESKQVSGGIYIFRVAGGWIYQFIDATVYVPFDNEFMGEV